MGTEADVTQVNSLNEIRSQSLNTWWMLGGAIFLVSVPVFVQAPLVRVLPGLSLLLTLGWLGLSFRLQSRPATALWGDLLMGFTWSWFAGSIYWGWLRWEPLFHIPVEAIGLPFVIYFTVRRWSMIGNYFYLGSLFGTAITDFYFYMAGLIPHWRQLMQVDPDLALPIFQSAIAEVKTLWGISWVIVLTAILLAVGIFPLRSQNLHWWAFSGAVLGTILVDSLFWVAAASL
jgi:hypothetical protein